MGENSGVNNMFIIMFLKMNISIAKQVTIGIIIFDVFQISFFISRSSFNSDNFGK